MACITVKRSGAAPIAALFLLIGGAAASAPAADLTIDLGKSDGTTLVGALRRWDQDGIARTPVDPKAKIEAPKVDATATRLEGEGNRWVFKALPAGKYDLVILTGDRVRVEGFHYPPVLEFDPFLPPTAEAPEDPREFIVKHISKSQHYENKVSSLFLAGDDKAVRIFMQLVRDKPTSYDGDFGAPVATVRHEVWQYTNHYGGWVKEKRTVVLDRILMAKSEFQRWTWVWEPQLGGIEFGSKPMTITYDLPSRFDPKSAKGWFPN